MLEDSTHLAQCFATLTYDDKYLPPTLQKQHVSAWLKRLRARHNDRTLRFFAAGEYGEHTKRPHYHSLLWGLRSESKTIQETWPYGHVKTDPMTPERIAYTAGYCNKKIGFQLKKRELIDPDTGECFTWQPPFIQMSRNPGIGADAKKYWQSWKHSAIYHGRETTVPRYLHEAWKQHATPNEREEHEIEMDKRARDHAQTERQLHAAEAIAIAQEKINSYKRMTM